MQVTIRPLEEQDAYTSDQWRNDPEVFKYTGNTYDHEITIDSELGWIRKVIANPNDYRCAIIADDVYVGNIYLTDIDEETAEYHIFLGNKDYWGKGVAKQASCLLLDYAFSVLNLKSVHLSVKKENNAAFKLYNKLGFCVKREEGEWFFMSIERGKHSILSIGIIG